MSGAHTLNETERQVENKLSGMTLDFDSMAAISNIFRAANATRNYLERTVLGPHELSWTGFVVLWVSSRKNCSWTARAVLDWLCGAVGFLDLGAY